MGRLIASRIWIPTVMIRGATLCGTRLNMRSPPTTVHMEMEGIDVLEGEIKFVPDLVSHGPQ